MALIDAIKEIDEKIAERDGTPLPATEPEEKPLLEAEEPQVEDEKVLVEAEKPQVATPEEVAKPTDADFARMRREKAAADKRAADLERQLAEARQPKPVDAPKPAAAVDAEPDKNTNFEAWLEWKSRDTDRKAQELAKNIEDVKAWKEKTEQEKAFERNKAEATRELEDYERKFAPTQPDYADVRDHAFATIARSLQVVNPELQGEALSKAVQMQIFKISASAVTQGYDPIEYMYHKTKNEWGYQPKPVEAPPADTPAAKPSIAKIAANKQKSGSSLSAGGKGAPAPLSKDAVSKMKFSEIAALGPEQFQQWENASKGFEG
jgi:hypothetical protein